MSVTKIAVAIATAAGAAMLVVGCGTTSSTPTATHATATPAAPVNTTAPATPAAPQYTESQQQAIAAAESYLSMGSGFSHQGLIGQLSSKYGSGFSVADSTFAVNHVPVSWKQQAVLSAKGYMTTQPGWSCSGLVQQLDSPYGGQFTPAQAAYATKVVGLGSC